MDTEATPPDSQQTTGKPRSRKKLWLLGITFFIIATGIIITPPICRNIEKSRDTKCKNNLNQLCLALIQYAMDNWDRFPNGDGMEGLRKLHEKYLNDYSSYFCPSAKDKIIHSKLTDKDISYVYFGGLMENSCLYGGSPGSGYRPPIPCPVIFDRPGNHKDHINYYDDSNQLETIRSKAKNCSEFIEELNKEKKYKPETLNKLREKAAEADRRYYSQGK